VTVTHVPDGAGGQKIKVTWKDHADNETGYTVQLSTDPGFKTGLISATVAAGVTSYQSGLLKPGAEYYVRVQAVNGPSASAWVKASPGRVIRP
jgi:hypothetical protein